MAARLDTMRTFVAVNLSLDTVRAIDEAGRDLKERLKSTGAAIRWVPAANIHQTMKFLGNVDRELAEGIAAALRKVADRIAPFRVDAVGLGGFPNAKSPRVIWIGLNSVEDSLQKLWQATEEALNGIGFPKEKRPFRPHLTIGRVKKGHCDLTPVLEQYGDRNFGSSTIAELVLYESKLHRSGAEYIAHERVVLSGVTESSMETSVSPPVQPPGGSPELPDEKEKQTESEPESPDSGPALGNANSEEKKP